MKNLFYCSLIFIGLSVSAIGNAATYYVTGDAGAPNLAANTVYDAGIVDVVGSFTDEWYFSTPNQVGLGAGVGAINYFIDTQFWNMQDNSMHLSLEKLTGSSWNSVLASTSTSTQGASIFADSISSGNYRLSITGAAVGTNGAGEYALALETVAAVPESETWAMLLVGTILISMQLRRKNMSHDSMLLVA